MSSMLDIEQTKQSYPFTFEWKIFDEIIKITGYSGNSYLLLVPENEKYPIIFHEEKARELGFSIEFIKKTLVINGPDSEKAEAYAIIWRTGDKDNYLYGYFLNHISFTNLADPTKTNCFTKENIGKWHIDYDDLVNSFQ